MKTKLALLLVVGLFACEHEEPTPSTPPSATTPTSTGIWKWEKIVYEHWYNGSLASSTTAQQFDIQYDFRSDAKIYASGGTTAMGGANFTSFKT